MGSIRVRTGANTLYFDFRYRGVRCREQTSLEDKPVNRRRLEQVMRKIENEIKVGRFSYAAHFPDSERARQFESAPIATAPASPEELSAAAQRAMDSIRNSGEPVEQAVGKLPLFGAFADDWSRKKEVEWAHSTQSKVRDILCKHLHPRFRARRIDEITRTDILDFRADLARDHGDGAGLSASWINTILNILAQILTEAATQYDFSSPFHHIKPLRIPRTDVDPFNLAEAKQIIQSVNQWFQPYYTCAFMTAMRPSEQNSLTWQCVDFERRQIIIRSAYVCGQDGSTKTPRSERVIDMSSVVYDALQRQRAMTLHLDLPQVFCNPQGTRIDYRNLARRVWHPTLKALGLRRRIPYQTRHTAATLWLASGESPEWIARQMGHTTARMLFTVYSRFVPNLTRKDGSAFERLLAQSGSLLPKTPGDGANDTGKHSDPEKEQEKEFEACT